MVKIDFTNFPCYLDFKKMAKMNLKVQSQLADVIYEKGSGIACHALALKIYNSKGIEEYNEIECGIIIRFAKMLSPLFYDSIMDYMKDNKIV